MDTSNPALAIDCPNCGLVTPRFLVYCRNCGFSLWPNSRYASAAFKAWKEADPARKDARRYDLEIPVRWEPQVVDYEERAHRLGIHLFPSSNYPFVICLGFFLLALAAIPFAGPIRLGLGILGFVVFLIGVFGWVVLEDVRMYPSEETAVGEAHVGDSATAQPDEHH